MNDERVDIHAELEALKEEVTAIAATPLPQAFGVDKPSPACCVFCI